VECSGENGKGGTTGHNTLHHRLYVHNVVKQESFHLLKVHVPVGVRDNQTLGHRFGLMKTLSGHIMSCYFNNSTVGEVVLPINVPIDNIMVPRPIISKGFSMVLAVAARLPINTDEWAPVNLACHQGM